eukprot:9831434-Prorocentrum_lima.AAC.1
MDEYWLTAAHGWPRLAMSRTKSCAVWRLRGAREMSCWRELQCWKLTYLKSQGGVVLWSVSWRRMKDCFAKPGALWR